MRKSIFEKILRLTSRHAYGFRILLLLLAPILVALYLYPPLERTVFRGQDYQQAEFVIEEIFKKEPTVRNLLADVLSTPLFLDWYTVTITNKSTQEYENCLESEPPVLRLTFLKGDPRLYQTNLRDGFLETLYVRYENKFPEYHIVSGDSAFFVTPSSEKIIINGGALFSGDCELLSIFQEDVPSIQLDFDFDISIKPLWRAWLARLIVISILWIFMISSFITIYEWLRRGK